MNLNDIMSGKRTGPGSSVLTGKQLDAIARETLALRARVAKLEAALSTILNEMQAARSIGGVRPAEWFDRRIALARAALKGA